MRRPREDPTCCDEHCSLHRGIPISKLPRCTLTSLRGLAQDLRHPSRVPVERGGAGRLARILTRNDRCIYLLFALCAVLVLATAVRALHAGRVKRWVECGTRSTPWSGTTAPSTAFSRPRSSW